jgi:hypothetical protein
VRRRWLAPALKTNAEAVEVILKAIEKAAINPANRSRCTDPIQRFFMRMAITICVRRQESHLGRDGRNVCQWVKKYPIVVLEMAWPRTIGMAGSCSIRPLAARSNWSAMIYRHQRQTCFARDSRKCSQRSVDQAQQIAPSRETISTIERLAKPVGARWFHIVPARR